MHKPSSAGDFRPFLYHGGIVNNNFYFYVPDGVGGSSLSSSGVQHAIKNENGEWGYTRNIYSTYNDALGVDPIVYTNNEINTHIANQYNENDVRRIYHRADRLVNKDDWDNLVSGNSSSQNPYYIAVSSNEWENKIIENFFKKDKVYKITFKNIDPRNFVQYRVPFDYINTVATCDQKVEIGITERTCEIYIKQLLFEEYEDPSIRDKIKFELKVHNQSSRTPPGGSINNFTYTNSGLTSPVTPRAVNYGAGHDADALPTPGNALPGQPNGFYSQIPDPDNPPPQDDRLMVRLMLYNQMIYNNNLLTSNRLDNGIILTGRAWLETEDLNNNGVLDLNEDFNNNGSLDTSPITWQVPGLSKKVYDIIPDDPIRGLPRSYMDCLDFTTPTVISGPDTDGMPNCAVWIEDVSMPISSTGEANLHLEITQSGSDAGPVTYTNGDPDVDIHDLILKKDQDPNNYDYGSYTNAVRVSSYDRVLDTDPSSTLSSSPPNRRYHLFDITDASTAWFTTPRHLTYEIAGYYDSSGELREFDTPLPRAAVNLSGLAVNQAACEDAPPGECWSWNWPEGLDWDDNDIDITSRSGTYNRTATDSFTSSKEGASQTFSHTHRDYNIYNESGSHYHGTGSGNKVYDSVYGHTGPANTTHSHSWSEDLPDTVQTDSGTYNQVSTVTDNIKIHFSTFDNSAFDDDFVQDYLVEKIFLNNDYSDTSTSEIGSNHTVRIQLKFDNGPSSHLDTLFAAPPDYAELTTSNGDNLSINSTSSIDKRFSITAQRVRRAGSTSWARTGSSASNNSVLSLIDGGSITTPDIHTYEWRISWRLEIEETITYTYAYDNTTRHSWSDSAYWDSTSPNGNHYYNSTSNLSTTETIKNLLTFNGTWEACSRVLVVRPPDCSIRRKDPLFNHPESGRDEERIPPSNNPTKVYPVGEPDQRTVFTMINRQNYFDLVTTSSTHPTYNVNSQTGRFHSPGVSISQSTANTVATIPSGQSLDFEESFTSIVYPGEFLVTWNPAWESDAQGVATPGTHPSWQGLEHTGNSCTTGPTSINIFVWADPPECIVRRDVFEKDDPNTRITVELVNPNAASMDIDSIRYEVTNQHDPSFTPPVSGFIPTSHPNDSIDPNGRRVISTRTGPPNDLQRVLQRDGEYNFEWSIVTSMGGESWTTLDYALTSTQQNSWFESINERITSEGSDPNERRTGYPFPGNSSHGTIPCTEQVRVAVKPYFKVFHGDVGAGGYFGLANKYDSCGVNNETVIRNSSGTIDGFIFGHSSGNDYSTAKGSSVQYGVQAHNAIAYFYSASQRPASPTPLKGLSFSNTAGNPDWGGDFGETSCISNYWREVENIHEEPNPGGHTPIDIDLSTIRNNDRKRYVLNYGQNLNIDGFGVNLSDLKATLFVEGEGNVYINSDIVNENTAGWNDRSEVGYLLIVVRGNIYIDPSVNRIDAVLVAYPDHINTGINRALAGEIWTCYYPGIDASSHYTSCNSDLIVNGALIAQRVRLGRINNSVIRATTPETPTLILPTNAFDIANRLGGSYNRGSEEINLRPEFLIGVPELPLFPDQLYKSDSITVTPVNY
ncbi:hypothetical protein F4X86_01240 [Candidatus Saccharibacteria bacterium]|nr:hypothetical protein [Candidatus Saccharibacteria bacterium]